MSAFYVLQIGWIAAPPRMRRRTFKKRIERVRKALRQGYVRGRGWDFIWMWIVRTGEKPDPRGCIVPRACEFLLERGMDDHERRALWRSVDARHVPRPRSRIQRKPSGSP